MRRSKVKDTEKNIKKQTITNDSPVLTASEKRMRVGWRWKVFRCTPSRPEQESKKACSHETLTPKKNKRANKIKERKQETPSKKRAKSDVT